RRGVRAPRRRARPRAARLGRDYRGCRRRRARRHGRRLPAQVDPVARPDRQRLTMGALVGLSVKHRVLVVLFTTIMLALGIHQAQRLPIDAVPDVTPTQVLVMTRAPGLAPLEIERMITGPVELAMSGLPRLKRVRSVSKYGLSVIYIQFEDGYDLGQAR